MGSMYWQTSRFAIDLTTPKIMGIVNVTPDSFSDGGLFASHKAAMRHCETLVFQGADILDIGGESTRPGAVALNVEEELARIVPVVAHAVSLGVAVSVDTYKPRVMQVALDLGADIINDIWSLRWTAQDDPRNGAEVVAAHPACGVCLMHMHREPQTMQLQPMQGDAVSQSLSFLEHSAQALQGLGVEKARICLDLGAGFGKTVAQNFSMLARQGELAALGYPVLAGWSRKSSLAAVTQTSLATVASMNIADRMVPSVVAAVLAVERGAHVVRVHDVRETVQGLKVWAAMQAASKNEEAEQGTEQ
jgi:dihydropteroate synthase